MAELSEMDKLLLEEQDEVILRADLKNDAREEIKKILDDLTMKGDIDSQLEILKSIKRQNAELASITRQSFDNFNYLVIALVGLGAGFLTQRLICSKFIN